MHCSSCQDSEICTSCEAGYGLYHDVCMICPTGTYLSNEGTCQSKFC